MAVDRQAEAASLAWPGAAPPACSNDSKMRGWSACEMPGPVSCTSKRSSDAAVPALAPAAQRHRPGLGELERVAGEVEQHLRQAGRVAEHAVARVGVDLAGEGDALRRASSCSIAGTRAKTSPTRISTAASSKALPLSILEMSSTLLIRVSRCSEAGETSASRSRACGSRLSRCSSSVRAEDGVHRRADLVAHVGQERALGAARLLGRVPGARQLAGAQRDLGLELVVGALQAPAQLDLEPAAVHLADDEVEQHAAQHEGDPGRAELQDRNRRRRRRQQAGEAEQEQAEHRQQRDHGRQHHLAQAEQPAGEGDEGQVDVARRRAKPPVA